ncbi:MAG: hypothetical protein LBJ74_05365 [Heliobacteriaceae bacterium]|jgi:hypothetical protein|nr:hypothetical protein [Heliobacteriaceae bacterium]
MGMTASQARLLSITARLSDNEHSGQSVSYSKQRLADQTDGIQAEYNAALSATKLTVLTGFSGSEPIYGDLSYGLITDYSMSLNNKHYMIANQHGQVLVTKKLANAFGAGNGNYNVFLAELGYSQADLTSGMSDKEALQKIHDAWDKYFVSVNKSIGDADSYHPELTVRDIDLNWEFFSTGRTYMDGYPTTGQPGTNVTSALSDWQSAHPGTNLPEVINSLATEAQMNTIVGTTTGLSVVVYGTGKAVQINSVDGFKAVLLQFATNPAALQQNYILGTDIDLSSISGWGGISSFQGVFDGNGYTISNLNGSQGLFEGLYGTVQNLNLDNVNITAERDALGGMAGYLADGAEIKNCTITDLNLICELENKNYIEGYSAQRASVGGLVGLNNGKVEACMVQGSVRVPYATDAFSAIGGFIGMNANVYGTSTISGCYADVNIVLGGASSYSGAINNFVGHDINPMIIKDSYAMGKITRPNNVSVTLTGLAGYGLGLESSTTNCVAYNVQTGQEVYWKNSPYGASYANAEVLETAIPTSSASPINFDGITKEQRALYDYASAITSQYFSGGTDYIDTTGKTQYLQTTAQPENVAYVKYLQRIFDEMSIYGYYTESDEKKTLKDATWFENQLKQGKLVLKYYSQTDRTFITTNTDKDQAVQEVKDERKMAMAEQKYKQDMTDLERKDKRFDLELKKLDTEHNTLQTEYDSLKNVINKNIEKTFNMFS